MSSPEKSLKYSEEQASNIVEQCNLLLHKIENTLVISLAEITSRGASAEWYQVRFEGESNPKPACLAFHSKFYTLNGFPKFGDKVIVAHNNMNKVFILYNANPLTETPSQSAFTVQDICWSSAKVQE